MLLPCSWACKAFWCWMPGKVGLQAGLASRAQAGGPAHSLNAHGGLQQESFHIFIKDRKSVGQPMHARLCSPSHHGCTCCRDQYGRLVLGDVITAVNRKPVKTASDLYKQLDRSEIGDQLDLEVGLPSPAAEPCPGVQAGRLCAVVKVLTTESCA